MVDFQTMHYVTMIGASVGTAVSLVVGILVFRLRYLAKKQIGMNGDGI